MSRTNQGMKDELAKIVTEMAALQNRLDALVAGRKVKVLSEFNGQPWGRSKRAMTGQILTVKWGHLHGHAEFSYVSFATEEESLYIRDSEIEWI